MNDPYSSFPFLFLCTSQIDSNNDPARYALWYKFDLEEKMDPLVIDESEYGGPSTKTLTPHYNKASPDCHAWSGSAACVSKLYMFGGDLDCLDVSSESQKDVFFYDTTTTTTGITSTNWQMYHVRLNAKRHDPVAVTIKDCVYVFGSIAHPSRIPKPWAEVLDTSSSTIKPLDPQPLDAFLCEGFISCSAVVEDDNEHETKIILCTASSCFGDRGKLLYYFVNDGRWVDVSGSHPNFFSAAPMTSTSRRSAVIDGVLYTYHYKKVYAYDLDNQEWFHHPVLGLVEEDAYYYEHDNNRGFVLDIRDGKLCVGSCSSFPLGEDKTSKMLIHYATFTPLIESGPRAKRAKKIITPLVHSKGYHVVHGQHFVDAIAML
ncbi:hypothetical protein ACHQM5_021857 [Ranunculus cassubicifolius]